MGIPNPQRGVCWQTPRTAWVAFVLGGVFLAAAAKLAVVDQAWDIIGYPIGGALIALAWFVLHWLRSGTFEIDRDKVQARRRWGGVFTVARHRLVEVEVTGRLKNDSRRVILRLDDGSKVHLGRVRSKHALSLLTSLPS